MKLTSTALALVAFAGSLASASAQSDNILAKDGKFVPAIQITETYAEKVARRFDSSEIVVDSRFSARVVANLAGLDPAEINEETPISLTIGDFQFDATIADLLPLDRAGNPLPLTSTMTGGTYWFLADKLDRNGDTIYKRNGDPVQVKVGSVSVSWANSLLTINVKIFNSEQAGTGGVIDGLGLLGLADDGVKGGGLSFAHEGVPVSVSFASLSGERPVYVKGLTRTNYRTVQGESFALNSAAITGAADNGNPVLTVTAPATDDGYGFADISGTVADLPMSTLPGSFSSQGVSVEVYVNDPDFAAPIIADEVTDADATGKRTFSFTFIPLDPGANTLVIVATDDSGNQTVVTKTINSTTEFPNN